MIPVNKPFLPPNEEYQSFLDGIWNRQWLTNMGPLSSDLELRLKEELKVNHLLYVSNGTIALQIAMKALGVTGEVITTAFSFVATTSSIAWEGCQPVFVDIDRESLNIDPNKIEAAITKKTTAILATHVYGNPCDIDAIDAIAKRYKLKVIYDAAHAFGVNYKGKSIFEYGDISTCSLHTTKLYHSVEGGLLITKDSELLKKMASMRNFGYDAKAQFAEMGINAKNSEFHAAMGLANLKYIGTIHEKRKQLAEQYDSNLKSLRIVRPIWNEYSKPNYAYYPVIFESVESLEKSIEILKINEIYGRRYFYPSLASSLPYLKPQKFPVTDDISSRVFCLPFYFDLSLEEIDLISRILLRTQNN